MGCRCPLRNTPLWPLASPLCASSMSSRNGDRQAITQAVWSRQSKWECATLAQQLPTGCHRKHFAKRLCCDAGIYEQAEGQGTQLLHEPSLMLKHWVGGKEGTRAGKETKKSAELCKGKQHCCGKPADSQWGESPAELLALSQLPSGTEQGQETAGTGSTQKSLTADKPREHSFPL